MGDDLRIIVNVKDSTGFSGRYLHIECWVATLEGIEVQFPDSYDPLYRLGYTAQLDDGEYRAGRDFYARRVCFRDMGDVQVAEAERMVKVLRRLHRHLDRLDTRFGRATTAAAELTRLADALGCTAAHPFGHKVTAEHDMNGTGYRWFEPSWLESHIAGEARKWAERYHIERAAVSA